MLRGEFPSAGKSTHEELRAAYDDRLVTAVTRVGEAEVAERTGLDRPMLQALRDGGSPELSLEDATAILATEPDSPGAGTLLAEARDILLMGMSSAVLDVEAIAAGIDDELEPKEIQQKVEGRYPMTLDEYARLHAYIEGAKR
jgi:hypothetical protein